MNRSDFIEQTKLLDPSYGLGWQEDAHEFFVRLLVHWADELPMTMPSVLKDNFESLIYQQVICQW